MSFKASADRTSDPFIATHANRLSTEQSPYLLQHAQNPVTTKPRSLTLMLRASIGDCDQIGG